MYKIGVASYILSLSKMGKADGFVPGNQAGGGFKTAMKLASIATNPGSVRKIAKQATSSGLGGALSALNENRKLILNETGRMADDLASVSVTSGFGGLSNAVKRKEKEIENLAAFVASKGVGGGLHGAKKALKFSCVKFEGNRERSEASV